MKQMTLAQGSFEPYRKPTRREKFLSEMEQVVPWQALCDLLEPFYPKAGNGRPPVGLMKMLRLHFLQHWYNLSDPWLEEALYESEISRSSYYDSARIKGPHSLPASSANRACIFLRKWPLDSGERPAR